MENKNAILLLSGELLLNVKLKKDSSKIENTLRILSKKELKSQLSTNEAKNTFWINIYNAYFQILASRNLNIGKAIFKIKEINIASTFFSLDDIEHGILRKYRWKKSFGYLPNFFQSAYIKELAVSKVDYRIHFALNCGAKSCPPIAFYTLMELNKQLDDAMYAFLFSETSINHKTKTIKTSKLLFWYQGDFGGLKGINQLLKTVFKLEEKSYKLKYNPYSWEPYLEHYV